MTSTEWRRRKRRISAILKRLKPAIAGVCLLGALGGCGLLIRGCLQREAGIVRIAYARDMNALPLFVALDQDLFAKAGLTVRSTVFDVPAQGIKELTDDQADLCLTIPLLTAITSEQEKPDRFQALYIALVSAEGGNDALLVRANSTMTSPTELRGRRIGISPGKTNQAFARLALRPYLGDNPPVTFVELQHYEQLNALKNRSVMALLAFEPVISQGQDQGVSRIMLKGPLARAMMDPLPISGALVRRSFAEENPKTARRLLAVLNKAVDFARKHNDEARRIAADHLKLRGTPSDNLTLPIIWTATELDAKQRTTMQNFADLLHRENVLESPFRIDSMLPKGE